jgi:hypothetical protein
VSLRLRWWVGLAAAAFVIRVGCFTYLLGTGQFRLGEGRLMLGLARSVAHGKGLQLPSALIEPTPDDGEIARRTLAEWQDAGGFWGVVRPDEPSAYLSPVYPILLAGLLRSFGEDRLAPIAVIQAILGALTCVALVHLGRSFLSEKRALGVGWVAAFYPLLVYQTCDIWDHCLFTLLLVLWVIVFLRAVRDVRRVQWLQLGLAGGVVFLVRPVGLPILALMWVWVVVLGAGRRVIGSVLLAAGFAAAVAPWVVRNWCVMGEPLLLPTKGGRNLWEFNNARFSDYFLWSEPPATRARYASLRDTYLPTLSRSELVEFPSFSTEAEIERDRVLQERVRAFLLANPRAYLELCWLRVGDFFRIMPIHARGLLQRLVITVPSSLALGLALLGALATVRRGPLVAKFLVCLVSLYAAVHIFTAAGLTYRVPVEPFLLLLAGRGLAAVAATTRRILL